MAEGISSVSNSSMYSELLSSVSNTDDDDESSKTTQEIITELQQNSTTSSSLTTKDIVDDYGVSYSEAQRILDKIQGNESETEEELPEDSTVSFRA